MEYVFGVLLHRYSPILERECFSLKWGDKNIFHITFYKQTKMPFSLVKQINLKITDRCPRNLLEEYVFGLIEMNEKSFIEYYKFR